MTYPWRLLIIEASEADDGLPADTRRRPGFAALTVRPPLEAHA